MDQVKTPVEFFALVELFGHAKISGWLTEQSIGGTNMTRVDVPETAKQPAFTRLFGAAAIYSINPVDEQTAKFYAERLDQKPIQIWEVQEMLKKNTPAALPASDDDDDNDLDDDDDEPRY
jgi:hypothetical protein